LLTRVISLLVICTILTLQGCATRAQKSAPMRALLQQGYAAQALSELEKNSKTDDVMVNMNRGMLRRITRDFEGSNRALEAAKKEIDALYATSVTEQLGSLVVNDESISFQGERFEQVLVHAYKALNYVALGDLDAARVEVLQSDVKMREWGETPEEDPFMRYLSGILFEALGETDDALIAYRKAVDIYKKTRDKHGLVIPLQLKHDLLRLLAKQKLWNELKRYKKSLAMEKWSAAKIRDQGELVVLMHTGLVPQRQQTILQTYAPDISGMVRIALPIYREPPQPVHRIRLQLEGGTRYLETVENIDGLARSALASHMPALTLRAIARAVAKKKMEHQAKDKSGGLGQLAMFLANTASEIADTRGWNTLPQVIQLVRVPLPEGEHRVRLEVVGGAGGVIDRIVLPVTVRAGQLTILSEHWTAPGSWVLPLSATTNTTQVTR